MMSPSLLRLTFAALLAAFLSPPPSGATEPRALQDEGSDDDAGDSDDDDASASADDLADAPPPLPPDRSPLALHAALSPAQRLALESDRKVITFAHRMSRQGDSTMLTGISLGMLPHPPDAVRALLADVGAYPDWLRLQPSYKSVRADGNRIVAGIGSANAPKTKRQMIYDIEPTPAGVLWTVVDSGSPLEPGSTLEYFVAAHPTVPGASLVVHEQVGLLPPGRMLKYLSSDDSNGRNRWWKDSNRHARRVHWAFEVAASEPPGDERRRAYIAHFQREFGGKVPIWAGK